MRDVLFMVDTFGSVSDEMLVDVFSEIKSALEQFSERLTGWLGFFDAEYYESQRFEDVDDLMKIRLAGGGGTRFEAVFECLDSCMDVDSVSCIVILTDGYAGFPDESVAHGIPVLWMLSTKDANPP